jgi:2-polyprenyl-3-methyl-5-hydroxy-6-metoxy-1,4-benzoquinol methylase
VLHSCPNCRDRNFSTLISEEAIRKETLLRARFVAERGAKMPPREDCKDLTDFAHGRPASILQCTPCTLLVRAEQQNNAIERYADDQYDAGVMERLFPRYVEAFRRKETPYRSLLREGAEVLEIGSHFGAFLKVAAEWGWKPVGIDVGRDTASFARSKGLVTYRGTLQDCRFPTAHFDAVFVWNCFEQIEEPHLILTEIKRVLKPGGLLLLRTPNALFYRVCEQFLTASPAGDVSSWVRRALAYNNLLAFPYLYGYQSQTLVGIAQAHGFRRAGKLNAEVIALTFPVLFDWILEEVQATRATLLEWSELDACKAAGELTGPWIEVFYRAV